MGVRNITFVNESTAVTAAELAAAVAALQTQAWDQFAPVWSIYAYLAAGPAAGEVIYVLDDSTQADTLGYHDLAGAEPVGFVFAKTAQADGVPWTVTASHELLEQLLDPYVNLMADASWAGVPAAVAYECCDPVEESTYDVAGVTVSDFVFPAWFGGLPAGQQLDYLSALRTPLTMSAGGYVSYATQLGSWQQALAAEHASSHGPYTRGYRRRTGRLRI